MLLTRRGSRGGAPLTKREGGERERGEREKEWEKEKREIKKKKSGKRKIEKWKKEKKEKEKGKLGIPIIDRKQEHFEKKRVKLNRKRTPKTFVSGPINLGVKKVFKINR